MRASSVRTLSRQWSDRLAHYRRQRNDEHIEALIEETARFAGLHLENDLSRSEYWSRAPLARRVAVLLFLVDRGAVKRESSGEYRVFVASPSAEAWVYSQPSLAPYLSQILELLASVRNAWSRRASQGLT